MINNFLLLILDLFIGLDAESTLVVVVSKTMTTAETMLNARTNQE